MSEVKAITERTFGTTPHGEPVTEYTLTNQCGSVMKVLSLGGIVRELWINNKAGKPTNVVLGFDSLASYLGDSPYFGALVGRVGNRIANAQFNLDGKIYHLAANNGPNNLHGGPLGFDRVIWQVTPFEDDLGPGLELSYISADGDQGFPGELSVSVRYQLSHDNLWSINYRATTDKATPVNLTQHAYFNLEGEGTALNHQLQLAAHSYTPVDQFQIPRCAGVSVQGTPFDFTSVKTIGQDIAASDEQLAIGQGYDHNYVLADHKADELVFVGKAFAPKSGISMETFTTEPCVQLYTGNFLNGSLANNVRTFERFAGFCLETQHLPDSPNQPSFPSIILQPDEHYQSTTHYQFT